jgi:hypothetical protein
MGQVVPDLSKYPDSLTLKMKALTSFEMSRTTQPMTQQCHIPAELKDCSHFGCDDAYLVDSTMIWGAPAPSIFVVEEKQGSRFHQNFVISSH